MADATGQTGRPPRKDGQSQERGNASPPEKVVTVLAISPLEEDHLFLNHIFGHSNWQIRLARNCQEALAFLGANRVPVIICEKQLPDGSWRDILSAASRQAQPPLLIVTSRLADDHLWAEVLNLGGYDVLMKPFDPTEVFRVVSLAWLNWKATLRNTVTPMPQYARAVGL